MIKACENCWETYDPESNGANEFFCPKCIGNKIRGIEDDTSI